MWPIEPEDDSSASSRSQGPYTGIRYITDVGKFWCKNGRLHRLDGPAVERVNGDREWWVNGIRHRLDGPAVERVNGVMVWYVDGKKLPSPKLRKI